MCRLLSRTLRICTHTHSGQPRPLCLLQSAEQRTNQLVTFWRTRGTFSPGRDFLSLSSRDLRGTPNTPLSEGRQTGRQVGRQSVRQTDRQCVRAGTSAGPAEALAAVWEMGVPELDTQREQEGGELNVRDEAQAEQVAGRQVLRPGEALGG